MIAVLDIGKTNKKTIIFDSSLQIVAQNKTSLGEYEKNGKRVEQPEEIFNWFLDCLSEYNGIYKIDAISVTTQGASLVCLDKGGRLALPPLAYTNDGGAEFDEDFYSRFGSREKLQRETLTAPIGSMINCAKLIYFLQREYPSEFTNVAEVLFYPQYFVNRLTGQSVTEPTYLGCHTYLFDAEFKGYSRVASELGITKLLPERIVAPWTNVGRVTEDVVRRTGVNPDCIVTAGIHDSNSSLLPYIITTEEDFTLNSSGTWCVLMHRSNSTKIKDDELGKTIFYNFDAFSQPVKTSVFMGGKEYEVYSRIIEGVHGRSGMPDFSVDIYQQVLSECDYFFIPSVEVGVGILPNSIPAVHYKGSAYPLTEVQKPEIAKVIFADYELAFAALNCSLAAQSKIAIDYTNSNATTQLYIEGGFRNNPAYCQLIADLYPEAEIYTTNLEQATAIGAGIIAKAALENSDPYCAKSDILIEKNRIKPVSLDNMKEYVAKFINLSQ